MARARVLSAVALTTPIMALQAASTSMLKEMLHVLDNALRNGNQADKKAADRLQRRYGTCPIVSPACSVSCRLAFLPHLPLAHLCDHPSVKLEPLLLRVAAK
jgi:hypothetical protein